MTRFYLEDRLRSFARMITDNYRLRVIFTGSVASITTDRMFIPPLENTPEAFSKAKFLVAHEAGHDIYSIMDLKQKASERSVLLGDILNCLEDARIEKLMTKRFEGLHALFEDEIRKIISANDYAKIPLPVQVLHGLYMMGKGYDTSRLGSEAGKLISGLAKLVEQAVNADNHGVLGFAEEIYEKLRHLEDDHKSNSADRIVPGKGVMCGNNLPDMVMDSLDEHKLPPDYDDMADYPFLKDENVDEEETESVPNKHPLPGYIALISRHTKHQSYLVQHLRSIIETKRRRSRKRTMQVMQRSGAVDIKRLWKLATGDDRVLKHRLNSPGWRDETDPDSLAVYILLDESHSMNTSGRIQYAKEAVAVLGEVLNTLGITFAITGYSTNPGLCRYLYKRFDEDYLQVRTRLVSATNRNGTYTQENIPYALRRLDGTERKKVLLVVTDAEEVESDFRFKRAVEMVKDAGVELLGVGINTSAVQVYFNRFVELTNLYGFSEELLRLLKGVLAG